MRGPRRGSRRAGSSARARRAGASRSAARRAPLRSRPPSTCTSCPRRRRCPRPAPRRTRRPGAAARAPCSRASPRRSRRSRSSPGERPGMEVRGGEQRVVVEHLLEVGDEPERVDRVAVEAAADVVVHAAGGHPVERRARHPERFLRARRGSRNSSVEAGGNLGACPKPPFSGSNERSSERTARAENRRGERLARTAPAARPPGSPASAPAPAGRDRRAGSRYASATARSTWRKLGIPCRGSGGKYVPPKNGRPVRRRGTPSSASRRGPASASTASM